MKCDKQEILDELEEIINSHDSMKGYVVVDAVRLAQSILEALHKHDCIPRIEHEKALSQRTTEIIDDVREWFDDNHIYKPLTYKQIETMLQAIKNKYGGE